MSILRPSEPVTVGDLEIESIDRIHVHVEQVSGQIVGMAWKEPVSVTVRTRGGTWVLGLERDERPPWDSSGEVVTDDSV
jgi:hypothetical protein